MLLGEDVKGRKKDTEGLYEKYLMTFMPIWLPIEAIKIMLQDLLAARQKKRK